MFVAILPPPLPNVNPLIVASPAHTKVSISSFPNCMWLELEQIAPLPIDVQFVKSPDDTPAKCPSAVLFEPVLFCVSEFTPTDVLYIPDVLNLSEFTPMAVFS